MMASRLSLIKQILLLTALIAVAYSNTLDNGLVWDDILLIRDNPRIRSFSRLPSCFASGFFNRAMSLPATGEDRYWRPLTLVSFAWDYAVWGVNPSGYHATNILLHALNAALVLLLFSSMDSTHRLAFPAALVFALHPLQTNAVSYISGRTDLIAALFLLLSCLSAARYLSGRASGGAFMASALFLSLSLMAKEAALAVPLILVALAGLCGSALTRRSLKLFLASSAVIFIYLCGRMVLGFPLAGRISATALLSLSRFLAVSESLIIYARLFMLPMGLHMERFLDVRPLPDQAGVICACLVLILLAGIVRALLPSNRSKAGRLPAMLCLWAIAALLPASNIVPLYPAIAGRQLFLGEQFLYIPTIAFSAIACAFLTMRRAPAGGCSSAFTALCVAALSLFGILTYAHNEYWRDELTFYSRTLAYYPGSVRMRMNLGLLHARQGRFEQALELLRPAAAQNPKSAEAHFNLGSTLRAAGRLDEALEELGSANSLSPGSAAILNEMGLAYMALGRTEDAILAYRSAVKASTQFLPPRINLAVALFGQEKPDEAIGVLNDALRIDPSSVEARYFLALIYERIGRIHDARREYRNLLNHYPACEPAQEGLSRIGMKSGRS